MAAYIEVLRRRFPGRQFTIYANDPRNLVAEDGGPLPSKAELDALMAEVDAEIEVEERAARQQDRLADVRAKVRPAALTGPLDDTAGNRLQVLRNRLNDARS